VTSLDEAGRPVEPAGVVRGLVAVQLYIVAAYVAGAVVPYLWAPRAYPPTWLWIVPGWLLGVPGFFIALFGAPFAVVVAVVAVAQLALRRSVPARLFRWCVAAAVLSVAFAILTLTPSAARSPPTPPTERPSPARRQSPGHDRIAPVCGSPRTRLPRQLGAQAARWPVARRRARANRSRSVPASRAGANQPSSLISSRSGAGVPPAIVVR
jgi:hypothetical protein